MGSRRSKEKQEPGRDKAGAQAEAGAEDRGGEEVPGELAGDKGIDQHHWIYFQFHLTILFVFFHMTSVVA